MLCLVVRTAVPVLGDTAPHLAAAWPSMVGSSLRKGFVCWLFTLLAVLCPPGCPSPSGWAKGGTGCCLRMSQFRCESLCDVSSCLLPRSNDQREGEGEVMLMWCSQASQPMQNEELPHEPFLSCGLERHLVLVLHFSHAVFYFRACQDFIGEVNAAHISKCYFMGAWAAESEMQPGGEQHCAALQPPM